MAKKIIVFTILLIYGLVVLYVITTRDNTTLMSWQQIVTSSPNCNAPCWLTIIPGVSTEQDITTITQSTQVIFDQRTNDGEKIIYWLHYRVASHAQIWVMVTLHQNIVEEIYFYSPQPPAFATLGTVLSELGPPDTYMAQVETVIEGVVVMRLIYENKGVIVFPLSDVRVLKECDSESLMQMPIDGVVFLQPQITSRMMQQLLGTTYDPEVRYENWQGVDGVLFDLCQDE